MKKWWLAAILAFFPITAPMGAYHFYLGNNRKGGLILGLFTIAVFMGTNTLFLMKIQALIGLTMIALGWINGLGYTIFGLIKANDERNFWNDSWGINWFFRVSKDSLQTKSSRSGKTIDDEAKKKPAKSFEEFSDEYFESLNLTPEEEKQRRKNMEKFGGELFQKWARGEYDEELGKLDGEYESEEWWDEFHAANQEEKRRMYSEKFESKEWWDEFRSAEPEKRRKMSKEKISADSAASGNVFIHNK